MVLCQVYNHGYFERNVALGGEAEAVRFLLLERLATDVLKVARRGRKRYWKAREKA